MTGTSSAALEGGAAVVHHQLLRASSSSSLSSSSSDEEPPPRRKSKGAQVFGRQLSLPETKREKQKSATEEEEEEEAGEGGGGIEIEEGEVASESGSKRRTTSLTDEDLYELRGSIDLGFGFIEEEGGHELCDTLPALNLYFAVNRQISDSKLQLPASPASTPTGAATAVSPWATISGLPSPRSPIDDQCWGSPPSPEVWKICNPGDSPQYVKTRLRHWAQAVACSLRQKLLPNTFFTEEVQENYILDQNCKVSIS